MSDPGARQAELRGPDLDPIKLRPMCALMFDDSFRTLGSLSVQMFRYFSLHFFVVVVFFTFSYFKAMIQLPWEMRSNTGDFLLPNLGLAFKMQN